MPREILVPQRNLAEVSRLSTLLFSFLLFTVSKLQFKKTQSSKVGDPSQTCATITKVFCCYACMTTLDGTQQL